MKTIKINEETIRKMVTESVKQLTSGALEAKIDVPAYEIDKEIKNVVAYLDGLAEKYLDRYDDTGQELYDRFGGKLFSISEDLEKFMKNAGYDNYLRKKDEEF